MSDLAPVSPEAAAPAQPATDDARRRRSLPVAVVVAVRPHQWVKNLFVGAPLLFAKELLRGPQTAKAAAAVAVFCLVSSATYLWNDVIDVEADRAHPRKRFRPIAAGEIPVAAASAMAATGATLALVLGWLLSPAFAAAAGAYLVINVAYSLVLKRIPYVDVLAIATMFLLRVAAGALAIGVDASLWLLVCTALLASFLGFGKRAHELETAGARGTRQRAVLAAYHPSLLRVLLVGAGIATVIAYACYTLAPHTRSFFHTMHMAWTIPFIAVGVGRFLMLVSGRPKAESPTEEMLRDPLFVANIVAWVAFVVAIIYFAR